ncbi:N-acetylmuramoyl-L-alanine amidase [Evtepia sp.]|uniref:N-acetylmuramoyl-L-alanine amidase n=1 Tax=Evtepia sp. TaxID=2773933 RepID=UPI003F16A086
MKQYAIRRVRLGSILLAALVLVLLVQLFWWEDTTSAFARLPEQTLVIDPGHGGEDGGAVSVSGQKESDINLSIALQLDQLMGFYGVHTLLTRETDVSIHDQSATTLREKKVSDIHNRVALIHAVENATLISIHQNSYTSQRYHGAQVFYADETLSLPFARQVQDTFRTALDPENTRAAKPIPSSVYLMNHISCRAILVECGFLSNPEEDRLLQEKDYQRKLAMVMAASYINCGDTQEGESLI